MLKRLVHIVVSAMMPVILFAGHAFAQQEASESPQEQTDRSANPGNISDAELKKYAAVAGTVRQLQEASRLKMIEAIEAEGMEAARYQEILNAKQQPFTSDDVVVAEDELENFEAATRKVREIQRTIQDKVTDTIRAGGLSPDQYQQIFIQVQQSPPLQRQIAKLQKEGG